MKEYEGFYYKETSENKVKISYLICIENLVNLNKTESKSKTKNSKYEHTVENSQLTDRFSTLGNVKIVIVEFGFFFELIFYLPGPLLCSYNSLFFISYSDTKWRNKSKKNKQERTDVI